MLRRQRALYGLALLITAASVPALSDETVRKFGIGSGPTEVGIVRSDGDNPFEGPQAITAGADGKIFLLDQVNHRVLAFMPEAPATPAQILSLAPGIAASDLIVFGDQLLVWDERPIALKRGEKRGDGVEQLIARGEIPNKELVLSRFAQMGSQVSEKLSGTPIRPFSAARETPRPAVEMPTIGVGTVRVEYESVKNGASVSISLSSPRLPEPMRLRIDARDRIGTVQFLDVDRERRAFVLAENLPVGRAASTLVARFKGSGEPDAVYVLPFAGSAGITRRPVTVTPTGDVLFLRPLADGAEVIKVSARQTPGDGKLGLDTVEAPRKRANGRAQPNPAPARTRQQVVEDAQAFEDFKFVLGAAAYGPDSLCRRFGSRLRRPQYLQGKLNQEVQGVSYDWGGMRALDAVRQDLQGNKLSGNVCTGEPPRTDSTGVDCSGLVSQVWGLKRHVSTSEFPSIAEELGDYADLLPADAIVKRGDHMVLFVGWQSDGEMQVINAAVGWCKGRVCTLTRRIGDFSQIGYLPYSYGSGS